MHTVTVRVLRLACPHVVHSASAVQAASTTTRPYQRHARSQREEKEGDDPPRPRSSGRKSLSSNPERPSEGRRPGWPE